MNQLRLWLLIVMWGSLSISVNTFPHAFPGALTPSTAIFAGFTIGSLGMWGLMFLLNRLSPPRVPRS